ncbi:hypothetical protein FRC10_003545 [Ceratobasidium sp. 414]|nr:hypothetical protein FRC10_003545 [Ceratobasidium sp. 414]
MDFPNGRCIILVAHELCLTLNDHRSGAAITVLPPSGIPGEQEWHIARTSNGMITLKNLRFGKYMGFEQEPQYNKMVVAMNTPTEFDVIDMGEPGIYK